jgi:nitrogen fixation-related uncharacterized protein
MSDERDTPVVGGPWRGTPVAPPSRRTRIFLWVFGSVLVLVAGTAFVFKLVDFIITALSEGPGAMASFLIPVLNYLLVASGFLFLFLWAYFTGQFRDVEAPKYRMLQMQRQIDRREPPAGRPAE